MGYSKQTYQIANEKLFERRLFAENAAERRKAEIEKKIPRVKQISAEIASCAVTAAKCVLAGGNVKEQIEKLKEKSLYLQKELAQLLLSNGFKTDSLEVHYSCPNCRDTGYYENNNKTLICECYKRLLSDVACEQLNSISPLKLSTFNTFDLSYYSDELKDGETVSAYRRMSKIFDYCMDYAKHFNMDSKSMVMRGATGLGKTHLSLAIANEVTKKGYGVIYVSAPALLSKLEREHFGGKYSNENQTEMSVLNCDLLIIDDIGTEFSTTFTRSCVYNIFNSRLLQGKPTIINTNLTIQELADAYSERFVSRVIGSCARLDFIGKDVRSIKSIMGK